MCSTIAHEALLDFTSLHKVLAPSHGKPRLTMRKAGIEKGKIVSAKNEAEIREKKISLN